MIVRDLQPSVVMLMMGMCWCSEALWTDANLPLHRIFRGSNFRPIFLDPFPVMHLINLQHGSGNNKMHLIQF